MDAKLTKLERLIAAFNDRMAAEPFFHQPARRLIAKRRKPNVSEQVDRVPSYRLNTRLTALE